MANELAISGGEMAAKLAYAKQLASASMLPASYRGNPGNVLWAIEYGAALGLPPVVAIGMVHVMDGKPVASATMISGLVRRAGHKLRVTANNDRAVAVIIRSDDPGFEHRVEFTMADANRAGLTRNQTWQKYPQAMLTARAVTACARQACPEALMGVQYTAEELGGDASTDDLPSRAPVTVETVAPAGPQRWSDSERAAFCASLGNLGLDYNDIAAWCESLGKPRPSVMPVAQRNALLAAVAGSGRARFDSWLAAQTPAEPVDAENDEQFFPDAAAPGGPA